jgi:hypothetical protein
MLFFLCLLHILLSGYNHSTHPTWKLCGNLLPFVKYVPYCTGGVGPFFLLLEVARGMLQFQFWSNRICASHRGAGQQNKERNRKWLERRTAQHQHGEITYNKTRTRKYEKSQNPKIPIGLYIRDEYDCKGLIVNCSDSCLDGCWNEFELCVVVHFG